MSRTGFLGWWICTATLESQGLKSGKHRLLRQQPLEGLRGILPDTMPPVDNSAGLALLQQKGQENLTLTLTPYRKCILVLTVGGAGTR